MKDKIIEVGIDQEVTLNSAIMLAVKHHVQTRDKKENHDSIKITIDKKLIILIVLMTTFKGHIIIKKEANQSIL